MTKNEDGKRSSEEQLDSLCSDFEDLLAGKEGSSLAAGSANSNPQIEQLLEISRSMHGLHERNALLSYVSARLREFFDAQNSFVILYDENGFPRVLESSLAEAETGGAVISRSVLNRVVETRGPLVISDTSKDPDLATRNSIEFLKIQSLMCAPLIVEDAIIGFLQFDHRGELHDFPQSDVRLLQLFANQVATAVHNLQLIERRDEAIEETRRAQAELIRSERLAAIGRLAAGVAHDFNNTLFIALGQCDVLLASQDLSRSVKASIERIQACAIDAARTVKRLQSLGPGSNSGQDRPRIDLGDILQELPGLTSSKWQTEAKEQGLTIRFQVEAAPDVHVRAQPSELREILTNLVFNAVDAMESDGTIRVYTTEDGEDVSVHVRDDGRGMTAEQKSHIFEPFFTTKTGRGHGLGLATCWSLADGMGGMLEVESREGVGTTMTLRLPIAFDGGEPESVEDSIDLGKLSVLVVEDDIEVRETLERMLSVGEHQAKGCASGEQALERLANECYDLVISDQRMPGMSGLQLAEEMRTRHPELPIVLLTGHEESAALDLPQNVRSVLIKPIGITKLQQSLAQALQP